MFFNWQWKRHYFDILVAMKLYLISLLQSVKETLQSRKMPNKFEDPKNPHHTHLNNENHWSPTQSENSSFVLFWVRILFLDFVWKTRLSEYFSSYLRLIAMAWFSVSERGIRPKKISHWSWCSRWDIMNSSPLLSDEMLCHTEPLKRTGCDTVVKFI